MAKYRAMASEGNFGANQLKVPDNSAKIIKAAEKKIRGMEKARAFEKEQEEIYLRAQKFAQGREQLGREENFKLETENRKDYIDAINRDYQGEIAAIKSRANNPQQSKMNSLLEMIPKGIEMIAGIKEQQDEASRQAASAAAYEHGLSHGTLKNVLALNANLDLAQFRATEYVSSLESQGWSEDQIDALYTHQYKTRGSKFWVDNKALAFNSVGEYETAVNAFSAENLGKSADEQILDIKNFTREWVSNLSINDRPLSAEIMGTIIAPKVRSIETRILNGLQTDRKNQRREGLNNDKITLYNNALNTGQANAIHGLVGQAVDKKAEREWAINWAINSHKSGQMTDRQLEDFMGSTFEGSDGVQRSLLKDYGSTAEVAKLVDYKNGLQAKANTKFTQNQQIELRQLRSNTVGFLNSVMESGEDLTMEMIEDHLEEQKSIRPDFTSPELEAAREWTISGQSMAQMVPIALQRVEAGAGEQDLKDLGLSMSAVSQEVNGMPSLLSRARLNDQARQNPRYKDSAIYIKEQIKGNNNLKAASSFITKDGMQYEIDYWKGTYNTEYWANISKGATPDQAHSIALGATRTEIDAHFDKTENFANGLNRRVKDDEEAVKTEKQINEFNERIRTLRLDGANKGRHAQAIGPELFKESTDAMMMGKEIPALFLAAAAAVNQTPFEYQQYLASAFPGVDQAEFDASSFRSMMNSIKPERMPLIRNTYGVALRPDRARGGASTAARRGSYAIPTPAGQQTPAWSAAGAVLKFAEGASYNVQFGGGTFDDFSRHPDEVISSNGLDSAAAGAYQFMPNTWTGVSEKLGLQNFGPESQEMAGRELAAGRGVDPDRVYTSFEDFNNNFLIPLAPEWASLPKADGKSYYPGQSAKSAQALWEYYQQAQKQFGVN